MHPVLAFPDYSLPFILDTDASDIGIGAVLSQVTSDGIEHIVAYGSRLLSKTERNYCVTRRELLAVVSFTRHFQPYLLGRHFTRKTSAPKKRAGLQPLQTGYPMQLVAIDILGPLPEAMLEILISWWQETILLDGWRHLPYPVTVAQKLVDELFCHFSPPEQLHSD